MSKRGDGLTQIGTRNGRKLWRARIYWIDQRTGKDRERVVTFEAASKHLASLERARHAEAARTGTDPRAKERRRFSVVADEWFSTIETPGSRISWSSHLRKLKARFGDWWLDAFKRQELQAYLDSLDLGAGTVNSIRDVLRHIFRYAARRGYCESNPAAETERRSTRASRSDVLEDAPRRALTEAEAVALLAWFRDQAPAFYTIAATQFVLGCRFSEVSALEWQDVDMQTGIVDIRRAQVRGAVGPTKGRYARKAALGPDGLALLTEHRRVMEREEWPGWDRIVFPRPPTTRRKHSHHWSISTAWSWYSRGLDAIGLDLPVATHLARHTAINIAVAFVSARLLRAVAGHKSEAMQARYLAQDEAEIIDLGTKISSKLVRRP